MLHSCKILYDAKLLINIQKQRIRFTDLVIKITANNFGSMLICVGEILRYNLSY